MEKRIREFRDGIFALHTRRFGTVAELMIEKLYGFGSSQNQFHDRYDAAAGQRIEIKFSKAMKTNEEKIKKANLIDQCLKANISNRLMKVDEYKDFDFDCNIQQVKRSQFDVLYYGVFFEDQILIFKMSSYEVLGCPGYSDFQHKGNQGEGQFHLNRESLDYHILNHLEQNISYKELYQMFS